MTELSGWLGCLHQILGHSGNEKLHTMTNINTQGMIHNHNIWHDTHDVALYKHDLHGLHMQTGAARLMSL